MITTETVKSMFSSVYHFMSDRLTPLLTSAENCMPIQAQVLYHSLFDLIPWR